MPFEFPSPAPEPRVYDAPAGSYTIGWLSDPQVYSKDYPETYLAMTRFLFEERERLKLQYVVCTGDLVNRYDSATQWAVADEAFRALKGVPYGVLGGNHDVLRGAADGLAFYQRFFGAGRFAGMPGYAESYRDNLGHCDLVDAGGTQYVFVYMTIRPEEDGYAFALSCFQKYPERVGVLCLHDYCDPEMALTNEGRRFYERVVSRADNLHLVLCGHKYGVNRKLETFLRPDGSERRVLTMLQNYQAAPGGGGGYMSLLCIREAEGVLDILNYSPVYDDVDLYDECVDRTGYPGGNSIVESMTLPLPWKTD